MGAFRFYCNYNLKEFASKIIDFEKKKVEKLSFVVKSDILK